MADAQEIDYRAEMALPAGKTCGDCVHTRRCVSMFGHTPADTSCDFHPSRYRERAPSDAERERLEGEVNRLENSFGYGPYDDGRCRDALASAKARLAALQAVA